MKFIFSTLRAFISHIFSRDFKWKHHLKQMYRQTQRYTVAILLILMLFALGVAFFASYRLSNRMLESQAEQYARTAVSTLHIAQKTYSEQVVTRIRDIEGVQIGSQYQKKDGGIPLPFTYIIELSKRLSRRSEGVVFRLYSDYPFPHRAHLGGAKDRFERKALDYLKRYPGKSFASKEILNGHLTFRYTEAVHMEASCIGCHNSLPESPKKDWKVGDVRGIMEVTQPLDQTMLIAEDGLKAIYTSLTLIIGLASVGLALVLARLRSANKDLEEKVKDYTRELRKLATVDELTRLANRRKFNQHLQEEWNRARREQCFLSLILCDVDYFKQYNDIYGHQAGDLCLKQLATALDKTVNRARELTARYGGEEFAIILPSINSIMAERVAAKLIENVSDLKISHEGSHISSHVTISMGIATVIPGQHNSIESLIESADQALYHAKECGRNQFKTQPG